MSESNLSKEIQLEALKYNFGINSSITLENLMYHFHYDKENGKLYWKDHWCDNKKKFLGKEAGSLKASHNKFYRRIKLIDGNYYTHSIIYFIETGIYNVKMHIDHIDGDSLNNRFENLRMVTNRINHQNRDRHISGNKLVGTHLRKDTGKWMAKIYKNGKEHWLGCYLTEEEAHITYLRELNIHLESGGK